MYLTHQSTIRQPDGLFEIDISIVNKPNNFKKYNYKIASEWATRQFDMYYRKGRKFHGIALSILNKFKVEKIA